MIARLSKDFTECYIILIKWFKFFINHKRTYVYLKSGKSYVWEALFIQCTH